VKAERPLDDGEYRALTAFRAALRQFLHFSEEAARVAGLPPAQHQLLLAVRGHAGPDAPTIGEVAEMLQLRIHSAGELVGRTVEHGLLEREVDPDDRRRVRLRLTAAGQAVLDELSVLHRAELRRFRREMNELLAALDE
jgi:DNA-binding MarR family transcriptional regulator